MAQQPAQIRGLKELRRGLKKYGGDVKKAVKTGHREVGDLVVKKVPGVASGRAASRGPRRSSRGATRLARSFKSSPTVRAARIRSPLPDAWGQEVGSKRFLRFPAFNQEGHVGFKTVRENIPEISDRYGDALMKAFAAAYPNG
jgi:hypothetical protein